MYSFIKIVSRTEERWAEKKVLSLQKSILCSLLKLVPKLKMVFKWLLKNSSRRYSWQHFSFSWRSDSHVSKIVLNVQIIQTPGLWEADATSQRGLSLSDKTEAGQSWSCSGYCSMVWNVNGGNVNVFRNASTSWGLSRDVSIAPLSNIWPILMVISNLLASCFIASCIFQSKKKMFLLGIGFPILLRKCVSNLIHTNFNVFTISTLYNTHRLFWNDLVVCKVSPLILYPLVLFQKCNSRYLK